MLRATAGYNLVRYPSMREIYGQNLVAWFDADDCLLVSGKVDSWADRIGARSIIAPSSTRRMLYQTNAGFSTSRSVAVSVASSNACAVASGLTTIFSTGSQPWVQAAVKFNVYPSFAWAMRMGDAAASHFGPSIYIPSNTSLSNDLEAISETDPFSDTAHAHTLESGIDSSGESCVGVDGTLVHVYTGQHITNDRTTLCIGGAHNGTSCSDVAHAAYLFFASQPSTSARGAGDAALRRKWGY